MDHVKNNFEDLLKTNGFALSELQWNQFQMYYEQLVIWNEKMNLTGITDREQVFVKHFFDSISLSFYVPINAMQNLADIGSGAGFPSIPLKIMFPHLRVTIVDSLNKRIIFLNEIVTVLGLDGVTCLHGRAEDIARLPAHRDSYDLVTARAVAKLNVLNELCLPFVKKDGLFSAMKGTDPTEEIAEAKISLRELNGVVQDTYHFHLPIENSERHIISIRKRSFTPSKYPRKAGLPLKQPIV